MKTIPPSVLEIAIRRIQSGYYDSGFGNWIPLARLLKPWVDGGTSCQMARRAATLSQSLIAKHATIDQFKASDYL